MKTYPLELKLNGEWRRMEVTARETLLDALRSHLGAKEVKNGCAKGDCGVCAVLMNGKAINSCLTLALQAQGSEVVTIKGLGNEEDPHPLQKAFVVHGAVQCGFCTPGQIIAAKGLLDKNPMPNREQIREAISGNLCRCTGYNKIVEAVEAAAIEMHPSKKER